MQCPKLYSEKYLLALRCLLAARSIDSSNPTTHEQTVRYRRALNSIPEPLNAKLSEVIESEFSPILSKDADLSQYNSDYRSKHHNSAAHVQVGISTLYFLEPKTHEDNHKDILRTLALDSASLNDAIRGLKLLNAWKAEQRIRDDYIAAAHARWPEASAFAKNET